MNISTAKQQIKDTVEAYLQQDDAGMYVIAPVHQRPVFLLGAPGIGKTAIMEQVAQELGIGIVSYSMTHHTRQSALGLPRIEHREFEGYEFEASEYTMSEIVAAIYEYMEMSGLRRGILFLDEINCVSETLYPSMLQFLQFKTFGKHKVPDGWVVVCAGNPAEYNKSVHDFDIVTLDRLRQINVEPDYGAWKKYATAKGLHPAVTTFLETKKDCFYKVESRPGGGKAFVTARGWEDLAQIIALYESMGKPVNRELFVQFLRDEEIADQFAVYYALFEKYRSDYQVTTILAGEAGESIKKRARDAEFDERIALISIMLDALAGTCAEVLDLEGIVKILRDVLRAAKPEFIGGATVERALGSRIKEREDLLERKIAAGVAANAYVRRERLVISMLREFAAKCALDGTPAGDMAFTTIERAYKEEVAKIKPLAAEASAQMDNAFDFVDACFQTRELLVFMAEVATRKPTTQFVAHYGNEKYYAHNDELQVDAARSGLTDRANMLTELTDNIKSTDVTSVEFGGSAGLSLGDSAYGAHERASRGSDETDEPHDPSWKKGTMAAGDASAKAAAPEVSREALAEHYGTKEFEYGFASMCKMILPVSDLKGKSILDVCCRRGKGVYKLSAMAGDAGSVIGVDWSEGYIASAKDGMERAWRDSSLKRNNMEFRVAYPEDLIAAGIGSGTMDVIYVNNVITLFYDQKKTIEEFARVLRPGGLLILETVFADKERDEAVVAAARDLGNSIQAARTQEENFAWLKEAGFARPFIEDEYEVAANRGFKPGSKVDTVPGDEDVNYKAVCVYVQKK